MKVEEINIGDLVRVWGWEELLVVSDIYFDLSEQEWCFDAYGLESREINEGLHIDQEEVTIVSRA
jgi:hypothetical protein|tara:strand:+ start:198 stop:392 length:195 start_codon:yes stop_codon:yes gene_type:complete